MIKVRLGAIMYAEIRLSANICLNTRSFFHVSKVKFRIGAMQSTKFMSSDIFIYILRHLFTYERFKLGLGPYTLA